MKRKTLLLLWLIAMMLAPRWGFAQSGYFSDRDCNYYSSDDIGSSSWSTSWQSKSKTLTAGNYDRFDVYLTQGNIYYFSLCSADGGSCAFDSYMALAGSSYGCYSSSTSFLAYNDDECDRASKISYTATSTGWKSLFITGYSSSASGSYTLRYKYDAPPTNTSCSSATTLNCGATLSGSTIGTTGTAHGLPSSASTSNYGVWYTFTGTGGDTKITVTPASGYDTEISVVTGSCGSFTWVGSNDSGGSGSSDTYTFSTTSGTRYYVYVAHYSSSGTATGTFTISRECPLTITAWANPTGAGTITGAGSYNYNSQCTLTATPASDYSFDYWIKNGTETIYDNPYTFTVTNADDFQAHFSSCPAPTNISATPSSRSATITCSGGNSPYNLRYAKSATFDYDFESAPAWTTTDFSPCTTYDGDGLGTYFFNGWEFTNQGYTGACIAFQNGLNDVMTSHSGNAFGAMFNPASETVAANDWFILPELTINSGGYLRFWSKEINSSYGAETINIGVYGGNGSFSSTIATGVQISSTTWTQYSYNLSAYAGQTIRLAIQCTSLDVFGVLLDDIHVDGILWENTINNVSSPYNLTGLTPETQYVVQMQSNCGSAWIGTTFTTTAQAFYNVAASANPNSAGNVKFLVGDGGTSTNSYLPCYTLYNYNLTQQIYTPLEIGNVGTINSIAFYNGGSTKTLTDLEFYMVHTEKNEFGSSTDWIPVTSSDLVFSGNNVEMTAGQWTIINLTTPFVYDGLSNLAIVTREHMQWSSGLGCRVFTPASGGNCSIYAYNDDNAYDVTNPSQYNGTRLTVKNQILVNPGGSLTRSFPEGATVTLVEELTNSDYHFENWTDNSSNAGNNEIYTISNLAGAHTVVANFAPNTHTLTASVSPANSGTISANGTTISGNVEYNDGTSVTLTANAATGYTFQNWTIDGSTVSGASTTITMDQDRSVVANFTLNQYTVQVSASPNNGGTVSGGGTYNYGASCTVIATHATNYVFDNWTENGSIVMDNGSPAGASYSFTVNGDRTLVANFHLDAVNITATAYDDSNNTTGGGTISGTGAIAIGSTCTLVATPGTGYEFVRWTENGSEVSTNATYSFTVSVARTLVAHFRLMDYTLTLAANPQAGGTVSANPAGPYHYNDVVTISATAATGYTFTSWSDNGTQSHTVTITGSASYTANFSLNQHTVTYAYTGTVPTGAPAVPAQATYYYGDAVPAAAVPTLTGYTFSGWVGEVSTMPDNDVTVTGSWTAIDYTLTLVADPVGGGTVSASPAGPYHYNDVVTVTATPNSGFIFGAWSDGGAQTHTITITDNTELTAYFGADQTLTTYVNPIEGGYVTIAENQVSTIGAVEVGDVLSNRQNNASPYMTGAAYSFQECLYLASDIGVSDVYITSISYYVQNVSGASAQTDDRIEVYMKNVTRTSFSSSSSDIERVTANDKVFDGTWHLTNTTGWVTIVLDKPFHYTGQTLMIAFNETTPGLSDINFKVTNFQSSSNYMNRYKYSSTPLDPLSITSLGSKDWDRANVRLGFGTYHNGESIALTAHANPGYQFVNWTENSTEVGTHGNATYTVTMNDNHNVVANFEARWTFVHAGNWNVPTNWLPVGQPGTSDDVYIEAAATIPSGCVAMANEITITTGSITIKDGGQLVHNNDASSMVTVTAENTIAGYTSDDANTNKGYELVSFPVDNLTANAITGAFISTPYDFYRFDASADPVEWIHMTSTDNISLLQGFIYASQNGTTISVTGPVMSSAEPVNSETVPYVAENGPRFNGWALLGNPFVCNAYVSAKNDGEVNFYKLNHTNDYDEFVPFTNGDAINPMGGVMFQVDANNAIIYSRTQSPGAKTGILNMDVTCVKDRATVTLDRARVRFGEGRNLEKFQFDTRHTKVYIPEGGNDFSVYYADGAGTIPVNFKAQDNGRYTLDFSTEEVGFNYLHLIDNMNGNDIDLLQTPYYAFDAKSTDFASRFTLVFATGNDNDDTFAFFNNGVWIINNDGEATLQVVDALGRVLSSETISGSTSKAINVAPGVYMLRLINGNDVKVQKIVVRR